MTACLVARGYAVGRRQTEAICSLEAMDGSPLCVQRHAGKSGIGQQGRGI